MRMKEYLKRQRTKEEQGDQNGYHPVKRSFGFFSVLRRLNKSHFKRGRTLGSISFQ